MNWEIEYYDPDSRTLTKTLSGQLATLPKEGVLRVYLYVGRYTHILQGMDNFWIDPPYYGCFNDEENYVKYPGTKPVAFLIEDGGMFVSDRKPLAKDYFRGVLISDKEAEMLGLI